MPSRRTNHRGTVSYDAKRQRWEGRVQIAGQRYKRTGRSRTEVERKLATVAATDAVVLEADRKATVADLLDEWLRLRVPERKLAPSTIDVHRWAVRTWSDAIGRRKAADLRPRHVEQALAKICAAHNLGQGSAIKLRSTLNQAMKWHAGRGTIATNPVTYAAMPTEVGNGTRDRIALAADERDRLLAELRGHPLEAMFVLSARAGLRPGEAAGVIRSAVDLNEGTVAVVRGVQRINGRPVLVDNLKTPWSRRALRVDAVVLDALARCINERQPDDDELLFTIDGGPVWNTTAAKALRQACKAADVPVISPNELRHTYATLASDTGMNMWGLADSLGHKDTRMVEVYYRHRPRIIDTAGAVAVAPTPLRIVS
jgi:integrase